MRLQAEGRDQWLGPEAVNESILMQRCANVSRGGLMSTSW